MVTETFDNSGNGPLRVPGFSCAVTYQLGSHDSEMRFIHAVDEGDALRLAAREVAMLGLMNAVTDKPNWHGKIFDDAIVERWHDECVTMPLISEQTWAWCLRELREKAKDYDGYVLALDTANRVAKSDDLVSAGLRAELVAGIQPLLQVGAGERDWHPGTNQTVLNLVHPSMYPLVYGRTKVLSRGGRVSLDDIFAQVGQGEAAPALQWMGETPSNRFSMNSMQEWAFSRHFQWLPCDVAFCGEPGTTDVRITSYINNLHPDNKGLYGTIEKLISLAIPLWNDVLIKRCHPYRPNRISTSGPTYEPKMPDWIEMDNIPESTADEGFDAFWEKVEAFLMQPDRPQGPDEEDEEDSDEDELDETETETETGTGTGTEKPSRLVKRLLARLWEISSQDNADELMFAYTVISAIKDKCMRLRRLVHPEPGADTTYEDWKAGISKADVEGITWTNSEVALPRLPVPPCRISLQDEFRNRGLQVIVKIASVELTPEKPDYPGGCWHAEGLLNEHIVATALFYYDAENVTPAELAFRFEANLDTLSLFYKQDQQQPMQPIFGADNRRNGPAVQELGSVLTAAVGSEEGTGCRVLAFPETLQHRVSPFGLADRSKPGHRRFATLWLVDPHYRICSTANVPPQRHDWWADVSIDTLARATPRLPPEIVAMVQGELKDYPMGQAEAEALRLDLMEERTPLMPLVERNFGTYNLFQH